MISNFWEDLKLTDINEAHEIILSEMKIPKWMNLDCPFCNKKLPLNSIREFGVKLNSRNLCDIFVVVCCKDCLKMDTIYFKQEINNIPDFIGFLNGTKTTASPPVIEEEMYKLHYNNLIEKAHVRKLEAINKKEN